LTINVNNILPIANYSQHDGITSKVTVLHAPNHRGAKGTDFIIAAIEDLKSEGINVELKLIENLNNSELLTIMRNGADLIVNELIGSFYGLFCVEAMATGLPVVTNLSIEEYTRVFRRFSYLNECPLVCGTVEDIKKILKVLISQPELREELGKAGRRYTEKYHSDNTAQFMFGKIYDKIWHKKTDVDLMNLFHPLKENSYNKSGPLIVHPLLENRIPAKYFSYNKQSS
jgi:hypothetical protein